MTTPVPHVPRSSRTRPARPALTREWIVEETIRIVRAEGLEKATMRRVAQALETGPASLYVHVANTADLHAAVTDALTADLPADGEGPWQQRLEDLLDAYRDVLLQHPGLARSAIAVRPMGPHTLVLFDRVLGLLLEGGVAADRAAWGTDLLLQHVTGSAAEHGPASVGDERSLDAPEEGHIAAAVRGADAATTPHVAGLRDAILGGSPQARLSWGIRALIAGIAATEVPDA
ncbi:MAG: TetR/AcrR family transcriptional regulator C-terminal domain-containing protein [Nocardioides sp.]|uniref:TetR/AcrR family transcriptional regulator C-terminal domain-containing protein n=1 Tax=Nocardioides sp. TaxID=35761 RepID=UPI003F079B21